VDGKCAGPPRHQLLGFRRRPQLTPQGWGRFFLARPFIRNDNWVRSPRWGKVWHFSMSGGALRPHVVVGGSISGASGVRSGGVPAASTFNLISAAFSIKAAEILGSLVTLASPKRIAA
jgi:hypothetical protein